jgi:hypothetical protein
MTQLREGTEARLEARAADGESMRMTEIENALPQFDDVADAVMSVETEFGHREAVGSDDFLGRIARPRSAEAMQADLLHAGLPAPAGSVGDRT